jgi:hypothetical protein
MPQYRIQAIVKASGNQYYTIEASDEAEALRLFEAGEGDFEDEQLEVDYIVDTEIEEIDNAY